MMSRRSCSSPRSAPLRKRPSPPPTPRPPSCSPRPPAPPKLAGGPVSERNVARFLTQATFGPTRAEIAEFVPPPPRLNEPPPKPQTFEGWINEQLAIPASSHLEAMRADFRAFPPDSP